MRMDSADFIESMLTKAGCAVARQGYEVMEKTCYNVAGQIPGAKNPDEIVLIGAHYDSFRGTCGANDNGSAVAAALALARRLADKKNDRTLHAPAAFLLSHRRDDKQRERQQREKRGRVHVPQEPGK